MNCRWVLCWFYVQYARIFYLINLHLSLKNNYNWKIELQRFNKCTITSIVILLQIAIFIIIAIKHSGTIAALAAVCLNEWAELYWSFLLINVRIVLTFTAKNFYRFAFLPHLKNYYYRLKELLIYYYYSIFIAQLQHVLVFRLQAWIYIHVALYVTDISPTNKNIQEVANASSHQSWATWGVRETSRAPNEIKALQ